MLKRVVITGMGIVNPSGIGKEEFWNKVSRGESALRQITRFDVSQFPVQVAGEITDFQADDFIPRRFKVKTDLFTHYALAAAQLSLADGDVDLQQEDLHRVGVFLGNNAGGWDICERGFYELYKQGASYVNPWQATAWFPTAPQGFITIRHGIKGYSKSFVCDRASGACGIYFGVRSIQMGYNDLVLTGGTEAPLTPFGMTCYYEIGDLAAAKTPEDAYQPFDQESNGIVLGEGSTILILEELEHARARNARIYGEVIATSMTTDHNPEQGLAMQKGIRKALSQAELTPDDIDIVFAEGSGCRTSDRVELESLEEVFDQTQVTVPKSMYGHLYGASGATELACALLAMETGVVPPTINLKKPLTSDSVEIVQEPLMCQVSHALVQSRAREGVNVSIIIRSFTDQDQ